MKYKVSLLPEKNRKRLNSKKKAEKVKIISLIALCMMLVLLLVTVALKFYADSVLAEEREKNVHYDQMTNTLTLKDAEFAMPLRILGCANIVLEGENEIQKNP